jgi:hypothetical protein
MGFEGGVTVGFFRHAIKNEAKSLNEGRPVFDELDYIRVLIPGDKFTTIERKATEKDKATYPQSWEKYQRKEGEKAGGLIGTPLEEWHLIPVSRRAELHHMNIFTVDALASVSDGNLHNLGMDGRKLRDKARAFIKSAKDSALPAKMVEELAAKDERIGQLENTIKALASRLESMEKKP